MPCLPKRAPSRHHVSLYQAGSGVVWCCCMTCIMIRHTGARDGLLSHACICLLHAGSLTMHLLVLSASWRRCFEG